MIGREGRRKPSFCMVPVDGGVTRPASPSAILGSPRRRARTGRSPALVAWDGPDRQMTRGRPIRVPGPYRRWKWPGSSPRGLRARIGPGVLAACRAWAHLLRREGIGPCFRSSSSNNPHYSPRMIENLSSIPTRLATMPQVRQAASRPTSGRACVAAAGIREVLPLRTALMKPRRPRWARRSSKGVGWLGVCAVGKIGARRSQFESDCPIV